MHRNRKRNLFPAHKLAKLDVATFLPGHSKPAFCRAFTNSSPVMRGSLGVLAWDLKDYSVPLYRAQPKAFQTNLLDVQFSGLF